MNKIIFKGVGTALITPFYTNGRVDYLSFERLIDEQIGAGVDALVVLGTTGEPATISPYEREKLISLAVARASGKAKIIVGCGSNSTSKAIELYKQAEALGADGALIVTPYYNKCTQSGIISHYKQISKSGSLPIIVYNVPSRTGVNILPETALKLSKVDNICGIKEASGNIKQIIEYFCVLAGKMAIYCGDDLLNAIFSVLGAAGYISVASNVIPKLVKKVYTLSDSGKMRAASNLQFKITPLINALFLEVNPIPVKAAMWILGKCKNELRLPLTKISQANYEILKKEIEKVAELEYDCK